MTIISKEDLLKKTGHLTVGDLKEWIKKFNVPDSAIIMGEIVDDKYFNGGCDVSGMRGNNGVLPPGSRSTEWSVYVKKDWMDSNTRYHSFHSPVSYKGDEEILFLDMHY